MTELNPELIERALWAWIENATEGVTRENVNPRVLDLNRHRAAAALSAVAPLIAAQALDEAAAAYQAGGWADDLPTGTTRPALILGMSQRAVGWLRARAAELRGADK